MAKILIGRNLDSSTDSVTVEQAATVVVAPDITVNPWPVVHDGPITIDVDPGALPLPVVQATTVLVDQDPGSVPWAVANLNTLVPAEYDFISLGYTSDLVTSVVYKTGGAAGITVATLALAYDGSDNISTVTRT